MPMLFDEFPLGAGLQSASDTVESQLDTVAQMVRVRLAGEEAKRQIASEDAFAEGVAWSQSYGGVEQTRPPGIGINEWLPKDSEAKQREAAQIASRITDPRLALQFHELRRLEMDEEDQAQQSRRFANTLESAVRSGALDPNVRDSLVEAAESDLGEARRAYMKFAAAEARQSQEMAWREQDIARSDQVAATFRASGQGQYALARGMYERGAMTSTQFSREIESIRRAEDYSDRYERKVWDEYNEARMKLADSFLAEEDMEQQVAALDRWRDDRLQRSGAEMSTVESPVPDVADPGAVTTTFPGMDAGQSTQVAQEWGEVLANEGPDAGRAWLVERFGEDVQIPREMLLVAMQAKQAIEREASRQNNEDRLRRQRSIPYGEYGNLPTNVTMNGDIATVGGQ